MVKHGKNDENRDCKAPYRQSCHRADSSGAAWGPLHLKASGCWQIPTLWLGHPRSEQPCAWAQPDIAAYLPGTRSPRHRRGDICTKTFPAHAGLTPLSCCVLERCDSSTDTAGVEELQSWCHQPHVTAAAVATSGKPKPMTNTTMNPAGNMGAGMSDPGCSHPSLT